VYDAHADAAWMMRWRWSRWSMRSSYNLFLQAIPRARRFTFTPHSRCLQGHPIYLDGQSSKRRCGFCHGLWLVVARRSKISDVMGGALMS